MSDRRDDALDREVDLLADAADAEAIDTEAIDAEAIDAEDRRVPPSFAAVLARAHRIDPSAVGGETLERVADPPVQTTVRDPERLLDTLVAAARAEADKSAAAGRARPAPSLRRPARRTAAVFVGTLAAASAVAATVALAVSLQGDALDREADRDSGSLAAARAEQDDAGGIAMGGTPEPPATRRRRSGPERESKPGPEPEPEPDPELEPQRQPEAEAEPEAGPDPEPARDARSRLERLDDRARAALAAGDLERADDLLAQLIRRGGQHRLVEAAFGDRFAIAHRLHSASEQRGLWRAYLERFPEGRFADDARAGLCRRAVKGASSCWSAYLDDFPRGAYRAQGERVLAEESP